MFLHFDDDDKTFTLEKTFIMPDIIVSKEIRRIGFSTDDTLDKRLFKFIEYDNTCTMLITGVPGMGKSSIVSWIANEYKNDDRIIILRFRDLTRVSLEEGLLSAVCKELSYESKDLENKVLILDGFDEMKALDIREKLLNDFFNNLKDFENLKCIITSRPAYIDASRFQNVFHLKEFNREKVERFYYNITRKVLSKNEEIESYLGVLGIPVILYMAIMSDIDLHENHTKPELYNRIFAEKGGIFDKFYNGETEYSKGKQLFRDPKVINEYLRFLREVAFRMFEKNGLRLVKDEYKVPQLYFDGKPLFISEFPIKYLFEKTEDNLEFIHKSIYEYFVSEYVFYLIGIKIESSNETLAGVLGYLFKGNVLSEEILEFLRYKIVSIDFNIISRAFQLMLQDGMTFYTNKCYKNVIDSEMNVFANMLEILHLWRKDILILDRSALNYIQYNKKLILNLNNVYLEKKHIDSDDLSNVDLQNKELSEVDLRGAYLRGAYLDEAIFIGADLSGTDLIGAHLKRANLTRANLTGAVLIGASLADAELQGAKLEEADLSKANLRGAKLENAKLTKAKLSYSMWHEEDIPNVLLQLMEAEFTYIAVYNKKEGIGGGRTVSREELFAVKE